MSDPDNIPLPISLNSLVFCFTAEDLFKHNRTSYVCLIPELLKDPDKQALSEMANRKSIKGIVFLTHDERLKETWQYSLGLLPPIPLCSADSIYRILDREDLRSLANQLLFILENLSRQKYFTINELCIIISRLTDTELFSFYRRNSPLPITEQINPDPFLSGIGPLNWILWTRLPAVPGTKRVSGRDRRVGTVIVSNAQQQAGIYLL